MGILIKQIKDLSPFHGSANSLNQIIKNIFGKKCNNPAATSDFSKESLFKPGDVKVQKIVEGKKVKVEDILPGPKGLPFIGTLLDYTLKKSRFDLNHLFLAQVERSKKYGPIYHEKIGPNSGVYVTDARLYQKVVRAEGPTPFRKQLDPMVYYRKEKKIALGMTNAQGEEWRQNRLILGKKMQRPKEVEHYIPWMSGVADDLIARISEKLQQDDTVPEIDKEICKWSLESLCTFIYEDRIGCLDNPPKPEAKLFVDSVVDYFRTMHPLLFGAPFYKIYSTPLWKKHTAYADKIIQMGQYFVEQFLAKHKEKTNTSLMAYLLEQPNLKSDDINLTIIDMMMGSIETTTNTMLWLLYVLAQNPDKQDILYQEIESLSPAEEPDVAITPSMLAQMQYLKACLKETFRLYPIAYATSRILDKEVEIAGYTIPAETHIQGCLYAMGRDTSIFENVEKFMPERWLRPKETAKNCSNNKQQAPVLGSKCPFDHPMQHKTNGKEESTALAPFVANLAWGHGARQCPGRRLAEQEIYITLFKILKIFRLRYYDEEIKPIMKPIIVPEKTMKIAFERRPEVHKLRKGLRA